jgi:uncharacterized protein (TIGR02186 family)
MKGQRIAAFAGALVLMAATMQGAHAERLVLSLSTHRVLVASNFTGVDLTLFGAIEADASSVGRSGGYALVATVSGPRMTTVTWRKERVYGIWVNAASRTFVEPPSYLAVLANRPIDSISAPEALRRFRVGLRYFQLPQQIGSDVSEVNPDDPFRQAFIRGKSEQGLYLEQANAVTFITPALFRAAIPIPANVSVGNYEVDVKLFADGAMIASGTSAFEIIKTGFEQVVAHSARDHGLLYGLATAMMALLTGWLASVVFRRD